MYPQALKELRQRLPDDLTFNHYPDRQSPWLLQHLMPDEAQVRDLRRAPWGKLLDRPALRPLVAQSGGRIRRADVAQIAHADAFDMAQTPSKAAAGALEALWQEAWQDFLITFTTWGEGSAWQFAQISREGGNLVLQLGFPTDHATLMGRYLDPEARYKFEESYHPIRTEGRPTLAWARLDLDLDRGEALIEEVQSDWLRLVAEEVEFLGSKDAQDRGLRAHQSYKRELFARYAKVWPQVLMLATLHVLRDQLGLRRIWMHGFDAGTLLKGMQGCHPPRSLYTQLPKAFCFQPVAEVPAMLRLRPWNRGVRLARDRMRPVQQMIKRNQPVFWRLDL